MAKITFQVERKTFRDKERAIRTAKGIIVNGQFTRVKVIGHVWVAKKLADGRFAWSRGDAIFNAYGEKYRMGSKKASPLKLKKFEEERDYTGGNEVFDFNKPVPAELTN